MSGERELIVGTSGSDLALVQTRRVRAGLPGPSRELPITTSGDRFQNVPLHEVGGVGVFTREIEDRLRSGEIDVDEPHRAGTRERHREGRRLPEDGSRRVA